MENLVARILKWIKSFYARSREFTKDDIAEEMLFTNTTNTQEALGRLYRSGDIRRVRAGYNRSGIAIYRRI